MGREMISKTYSGEALSFYHLTPAVIFFSGIPPHLIIYNELSLAGDLEVFITQG